MDERNAESSFQFIHRLFQCWTVFATHQSTHGKYRHQVSGHVTNVRGHVIVM